MIKATSRRKKATTEDDNRDNDMCLDGEDIAGDAEDFADVDGGDDDEDMNITETEPIAGELSELERKMNMNGALHCHPQNTRIHPCKTCGIRLLSCAAKIHIHESHLDIVEEADGACDDYKK
mmetsp:Transcript_30968/g.52922  ORF Transcript_30968/g.52922 Transcript_30968/m.52922 type:complete len:122 (+) Transcript_30968:3-368(+)